MGFDLVTTEDTADWTEFFRCSPRRRCALGFGYSSHADERTARPQRTRRVARVLGASTAGGSQRRVRPTKRPGSSRSDPEYVEHRRARHRTSHTRNGAEPIALKTCRSATWASRTTWRPSYFQMPPRSTQRSTQRSTTTRRTHSEPGAVIASIDDLGQQVPLPAARWYLGPKSCTVRWTLLHLIEETDVTLDTPTSFARHSAEP